MKHCGSRAGHLLSNAGRAIETLLAHQECSEPVRPIDRLALVERLERFVSEQREALGMVDHSATQHRGSNPIARAPMHNRKSFTPSAMPLTTLEEEYALHFTSTRAPHQRSFYAEEYSLAQPSALKYVDSITSPNAEV